MGPIFGLENILSKHKEYGEEIHGNKYMSPFIMIIITHNLHCVLGLVCKLFTICIKCIENRGCTNRRNCPLKYDHMAEKRYCELNINLDYFAIHILQ